MKSSFISRALGGLKTPNPGFTITAAFGFWISLVIFWHFAPSVLGSLPPEGPLFSLGLLLLFFAIRVPCRFARLPAILGLCSAAVLVSLYFFLEYIPTSRLALIDSFFFLAYGLGLAGAAIDAEWCWHFFSRKHGHPHLV